VLGVVDWVRLGTIDGMLVGSVTCTVGIIVEGFAQLVHNNMIITAKILIRIRSKHFRGA
jgi:hypothetical protein